MRNRILVVDDELPALSAIRRMLHPFAERWHIECRQSADQAWGDLVQNGADAVLTDVSMPVISGLDLLDRIRSHENTRHVPVIVLTGLGDHDLKRRALERGAADLLTKPVDRECLIARLEQALQHKQYEDQLRSSNAFLDSRLREHASAAIRGQFRMACSLANLAEHRDPATGDHVIRVGCYSWVIARYMGLDRGFCDRLLLAAPLHDLGKIGIPDAILRKAGPLTPGERVIMQTHCAAGAKMLREPSGMFEFLSALHSQRAAAGREVDPLLDLAASIALSHHEKWNGGGYPYGLAGESIPLEARIVAVADVFDALRSDRPYRPACTEEETLAMLEQISADHFDPAVYAAFCQALSSIRDIRDELCRTPLEEALPL